MDRLTAMRSFIEVANTCSFTKAAENLNLSRLQVSRHVQELEAWLKQRLIHRTTRRVSLTQAGESALQHCEQILYQTTELELKALEPVNQLTGTIRVAAPIGLAQALLLEAVSLFTDLYPNVVVDILASDRFSQLVDERVDIALRFTDQPDDSLIAKRLMVIDSVICVAPEYFTQHASIQHPDDLKQHNCFVHLNANKWHFIRDNQSLMVPVSGNLCANDARLLALAATKGKGVVRLPCDLANPFIAQQQLTPILLDYRMPSTTLWAVYLSRSYQTTLVRRFIDFLSAQWQHNIQVLEH